MIGIILFAWLYALFWAAVPLLGWSTYTLDNTKRRCTINFQPKDVAGMVFLSCLMIFFYIIPIISIIVCLCFLQRFNAKDCVYLSKTYGKKNIATVTYKVKSRNKFKLGCTMLIVFIMAWTPYAVTGVVSQFHESPVWLTDASAILAKSSPLINPILYCYRINSSKQTRKTFVQKFKRLLF